MKVKGNQTFMMLNGRLAKSKKICQQKSGAEALQWCLEVNSFNE
jgi:hypothetical protein